MSQPTLERRVSGATAARALLRERPAVRRVGGGHSERPRGQAPERPCFRRVRRHQRRVERGQLASQGEVRTNVITRSDRSLQLRESGDPQVRRFQFCDERAAATDDNEHVVAPALQRCREMLHVQAGAADDVAARNDERNAHTSAVTHGPVASGSGAYAGPHTRAANTAARAGTRLQRLFDHVGQKLEPQARRQPDHEHGHGHRDDDAATENHDGRRADCSQEECGRANGQNQGGGKRHCRHMRRRIRAPRHVNEVQGKVRHEQEVRDDRGQDAEGDATNAPPMADIRATDNRGRVRPLAPRSSIHRAGRASEGVAELVTRPEEHAEHHDAERGLEGHPRRPKQHSHYLVAQHCDDKADGKGQEREDCAAVPKRDAELLEIVLHARQRGKQHLVRDLSEERCRERHHGVRAPVETERIGTERAADNEVVALHRDPVPELTEELAAAVGHEMVYRLTRETRSPRVRDNDPQQGRVHDGHEHLTVHECPRAPPRAASNTATTA